MVVIYREVALENVEVWVLLILILTGQKSLLTQAQRYFCEWSFVTYGGLCIIRFGGQPINAANQDKQQC